MDIPKTVRANKDNDLKYRVGIDPAVGPDQVNYQEVAGNGRRIIINDRLGLGDQVAGVRKKKKENENESKLEYFTE